MPSSHGARVVDRRPLTRLDRLCLASLLVATAWCGLFALFPGARGGPLPYFCAGMLLSALLVALGIRWAPVLGALLSGVVLVSLFTLTGYVVFHLTQPKAQFAIFVSVLLFLAAVVVSCGLSLYTAVRHYGNYTQTQSQAGSARWLLPAFTGFCGIVLGAILIAAIAQPAAGGASSASGEPVVHLEAATFAPALVAVPEGSKLLVVDDATITHILANGTWNQGRASLELQPGAPRVDQVHVASGSVEIGPFTTAGTYHILCLVHPGMNLTVVVP